MTAPDAGLPSDPMERAVYAALTKDGVPFTTDPRDTAGLDFRVLNAPVYIEVKRFHSDRIGEQMSRVDNVIAVQGHQAVTWFAALFHNHASVVRLKREQERRKNEWRKESVEAAARIEALTAEVERLTKPPETDPWRLESWDQSDPAFKVECIRRALHHWLTWENDPEARPDQTVRPPTWPSRGAIAVWVRALDEAARSLTRSSDGEGG